MKADIDMEKVKSALAKINARKDNTVRARRISLARELTGAGVGEYTPPPSFSGSFSGGRYVTKIARGCTGFNHPHFHQ